MSRLLSGVEVIVIRRVPTGSVDAMGEPVTKEECDTVESVLWSPYSSADVDDAQRPHGDVSAIKLHFPKTYPASLAGCDVEVDGSRYRIQGDPQGYLPHLTPGRWNRTAIGKKVEG